jgi:hypothetical protein
MPERRTVPQLREKLRFLMRSEIARAIGKYNASEKSFGTVTGIGREALRHILHNAQHPQLNETHEQKIAECCKFRIDMPQWRTGTVKEFIAEYERLKRHNSQERQTDLELAIGPDIDPEPSPIKGLASVQIFPAQYGRGHVDIGFELSCGQLRGPFGLVVQIRCATIELGCFPGSLRRETRKGFDKAWPCSGSNGPVMFQWSAGSTFTGRWRATASGDGLGNLDVPPDFVTVESLAPGDEIAISLSIRVKDLAPSDDGEAILLEDGRASGEDVSIEPRSDQAPTIAASKLSDVKKKILARLATETLVDDGDGFVVHARHRIGLVEKKSFKEDNDGR